MLLPHAVPKVMEITKTMSIKKGIFHKNAIGS